MSHTPGPWTIKYGGMDGDGYFVIGSRDGDMICDSHPLLPPDRIPYDARLISAAPALLDVLEDMVSLYEPADEMKYPPGRAVPRKVSVVALARKVIAEVRGRT